MQNFTQIISLLQKHSKSQNKYKTICPHFDETKEKYPKIQFSLLINNITYNVYIQSNTKTHAVINLIEYINKYLNNSDLFTIHTTKSKTKIIPTHKHIPCLYIYISKEPSSPINFTRSYRTKQIKKISFQTIEDYISNGGIIEIV